MESELVVIKQGPDPILKLSNVSLVLHTHTYVTDVPNELPEVGVVRLLLEPQGPHVVVVRPELG